MTHNYLIARFRLDGGRQGTLDGTMLLHESAWTKAQGAHWYASDVLGKHSEVWGNIGDEGNWSTRPLTDQQADFLCEVFDIAKPPAFSLDTYDGWNFPAACISGFNPLDYIREGWLDDEEEQDEEK